MAWVLRITTRNKIEKKEDTAAMKRKSPECKARKSPPQAPQADPIGDSKSR